MILTPTQLKAFNDALRVIDDKTPQLEWLRKVAEAAPEYAERVQEVLDMAEHLRQLCTVGLAMAG